MFEYALVDGDSIKRVAIRGRIDALSTSELEHVFNGLIDDGERVFVADMTAVHYVSSAGLRVFVATQKALKKVGGEIILQGMTGSVHEVFRISGLLRLFRIASDRDALAQLLAPGKQSTSQGEQIETGGVLLRYHAREAAAGSLIVPGSQDKMDLASYSEKDVVSVEPATMPFGLGLATVGDAYDEYKYLFGESMIVNNSIFFYPAVKRPSVDYLIDGHKNPGLTYKFLHGAGFSGDYRYVLSFHGNDQPVTLDALAQAFFLISQADLVGFVLVGESKGIWGLHIKQPPLTEFRPPDEGSIFDSGNIARWIDYPIEPARANHAVVVVGLTVRKGSPVEEAVQSIIPRQSAFHAHGGIFDKIPIGTDMDHINDELNRIFMESRVYSIEHLLGRSLFSSGMAALVEIDTKDLGLKVAG